MLLPEMKLSKDVTKCLDLFGFYYFHPSNEGKRTHWEQRAFKANGGKPGVPDLIIVLKNKVLFVELKTPKGRQTEHQKFFQEVVERRGHEYLVWRSLDDAHEFCLKNGGLK